MKKKPSFSRSVINGFYVVLGILILAYGFKVTEVNFKETRSETRLTQLTRIIRALAHPDIVEYEKEEISIETPIYVPCPKEEISEPKSTTSGPHIIIEPNCANPGDFIIVKGYQFVPDTKGPINFIPPSGASLTIGNFEVDVDGFFEQKVQLPKRQPVDKAQTLRIIARQNVGFPHISEVAKATWEKIIETVFLALLATFFGTLLAIPVSFFAARNLMSDIKSPMICVALTILGWPLGIGIGIWASSLLRQLNDAITSNLVLSIGSVIVCPFLAWIAVRWALPVEESQKPGHIVRLTRLIAGIIAAVVIILFTYLLSHLMYIGGEALSDKLGKLSFIGYFIAQIGEILRMITPAGVALASGAILSGTLSKIGLLLSEHLSIMALKTISFLLAALAGMILFIIIGAGINWLYQIGNPVKTLWIPAAVGALVGGVLPIHYKPTNLLPIGSTIYFIMRTILNAIRSIEPLIYVIVFVVWVGIGPFAGALALALHTIAALAKLYSEQVESISPGPLEAVTATGATRLQTIVYAVVPQIIPPYISFTMYRWDINVRMSTIIGFAGGGGIGFLLQQNIRLLDYRAAAVQMLAIAFVVATMDYTSALIREKFV
jgi:phosphonate ABC transporter permease subunit PhnE